MVFSSIVFLFAFLPVVLTGYMALFLGLSALAGKRTAVKAGNSVLVLSSLVFYAWGEPTLVCIILVSITIDYIAALVMTGTSWREQTEAEPLPVGGPRTRRQKAALVAAIVGNLTLLGFFKYCNFGLDNLRALCSWAGYDWFAWSRTFRVALPIGISFYTFQSMSYTIDVYRGKARATPSLLDFACFVSLFPQLVAGPIVRYRHIAAQLRDRSVTCQRFASGARRFVVGLGKKVLIANTLAVPVGTIFSLPTAELTMGLAWFGVLCFAMELYFDFSGYSDMAIGLGRILGFDLLENFDYPYISRSVREIWRRWHISLSTWFRDYVYLPLGGSRGSAARVVFNLWVVFLLCGLWHGAAWTYVVFGCWHGLFLILERGALGRWLLRLWRPLQHLYVLCMWLFGLALFRSTSFGQARAFWSAMVGLAEGLGARFDVALLAHSDVVAALVAGVLFSMPVVPLVVAWWQRTAKGWRERVGYAVEVGAVCALLLLSAASLAVGTYQPFFYYRF